jgi:hypothetical protein
MKKAYVYAIIVDGVIRYFGKGSGNRKLAHMRMVRSIARRRAAGETVRTSHFYNRLTKAWLEGAEIAEIILVEGLTNEEAYAREIAEIAAAPQGQLWNTWPGGEGGGKGHSLSLEHRQKIAESNRKTWSDPEVLAKQSEQKKIHWLRPEYQAQLVGRKWTPEMKQELSDTRKAQWADPEFEARMQASKRSAPEFHAKRSEERRRSWETRRKSKTT